ncbi:hypothetical protein GAH_02040 [Geoglobus ahangari]|uniref:Uncharacterized protein n=1 Tax=Geoglobus ahangari TaxID=113653 RepID=A0A0F7DB93_9EURY|nr:winged helix DNA-binding protein [Geoglobus ahangari]AKG90691.1 hypothetical protein GAH_02040 [Geoglobus ahangari]NOY11799.1 hypothetical protein [Archaeoglobi archaeon]
MLANDAVERGKLIFKERVVQILMTIYEGERSGEEVYIQYIAGKINSPHSYVWLVVKKLEQMGIVETSSAGRTRLIHLTDKGHELCDAIQHILELLR